MKKHLKTFFLIILLIFLSFSYTDKAHAKDGDTITVYTTVNMSSTQNITGLILYDDHIKEINHTEVEFLPSQNELLISFQIYKKDITSTNVHFSAVVTTNTNELIFAKVKDLSTAFTMPTTKECALYIPPAITSRPLIQSTNKLERIIQLRESRRDISKREYLNEMNKILANGSTVAKLANTLARNSGLGKQVDFTSEELPVLTLVYKLARLENTLMAHQSLTK